MEYKPSPYDLKQTRKFKAFLKKLLTQMASGNFKVIVLDEFEGRVIGYSEIGQTIDVRFDSDTLTEKKYVTKVRPVLGNPNPEPDEDNTYRELEDVPVKITSISFEYVSLKRKTK